MIALVSAFACGLVFGMGLVISGMTQPTIVLGFLDVFGAWDPTLLIVMAAALIVTVPGFWLSRQRGRTVSGDAIQWPSRTDIDRPLVAGALLFGAGWGLIGLCPGPAVVNLASLSPRIGVFVIAMVLGMGALELWRKRAAAG
jgi:hypothetical protein